MRVISKCIFFRLTGKWCQSGWSSLRPFLPLAPCGWAAGTDAIVRVQRLEKWSCTCSACGQTWTSMGCVRTALWSAGTLRTGAWPVPGPERKTPASIVVRQTCRSFCWLKGSCVRVIRAAQNCCSVWLCMQNISLYLVFNTCLNTVVLHVLTACWMLNAACCCVSVVHRWVRHSRSRRSPKCSMYQLMDLHWSCTFLYVCVHVCMCLH